MTYQTKQTLDHLRLPYHVNTRTNGRPLVFAFLTVLALKNRSSVQLLTSKSREVKNVISDEIVTDKDGGASFALAEGASFATYRLVHGFAYFALKHFVTGNFSSRSSFPLKGGEKHEY